MGVKSLTELARPLRIDGINYMFCITDKGVIMNNYIFTIIVSFGCGVILGMHIIFNVIKSETRKHQKGLLDKMAH